MRLFELVRSFSLAIYLRVELLGYMGFPGDSWLTNTPANAGDAGDKDLIPGRSPLGGSGNPLPYSCKENPMDSRTWQSIVHGVAKESDMTEHTHTHTHTHTQ